MTYSNLKQACLGYSSKGNASNPVLVTTDLPIGYPLSNISIIRHDIRALHVRIIIIITLIVAC